MRQRWALLAVCIIGCGQEEHIPPLPGGGGGPAGGGDDDVVDGPPAVVDGPVPGELFDGRVCVLLDLRDPEKCAGENAIVQVKLGNMTVTTHEDGAFQMMRPAGNMLEWEVTQPGLVVHSKMTYDPTDAKVFAIHTTNYNNLLAANGLMTTPGQGAMILRFATGSPIGLSVSIANPAHSTRYDTTDPDVWPTAVGTGSHNVAWFAGESPGDHIILVSTPDDTTDTTRTFEPDVLRWESFKPTF